MADKNYDGTKITQITQVPPTLDLATAKVLVVTQDNQYLLPMSALVTYLKDKVNSA